MRIYTSRYGNSQSIKKVDAVPIRTSVGAPRASFHYETVLDLAPMRPWLKLPYDRYRPLYLDRLETLGVDRIRGLLETAGAGWDVVLLCYENLWAKDSWCHRRLFAEWWQEQTGEVVAELDDRPPAPRQRRTLPARTVSKAVHEKAMRLIAAGALTYHEEGFWSVEGDHGTYRVDEESCTCRTGPELMCSHRLAISMMDAQGRLFA